MSRFFTKCPFCQEVIKGDSEWIKQEVSCPYCQKEFELKLRKKNKLPVHCKYCYTEIDVRDSICFFCGEKNVFYMPPPSKKSQIKDFISCTIFFVIVLLILSGLVSCCYSCCKKVSKENNSSSYSSKSSSSNYNSKKWDVLDMAERHLKNNYLKAPSTAKFKHIPEDSISNAVQKIGPNRYRVTSYVDAQNSYGAMIRTNFTIEIYKKRGSWYAENLITY